MQVTQDIKARVTAKLQEGLDIANKRYNLELKMPIVDYRLTGTTAGKAMLREWRITLNAVLLMENVDTFIARTVPHELAHLITDMVYPEAHQRGWGKKRQPHGAHWQSVMRVLGVQDITRCHSYDVSNSKRQTSRASYTYQCVGCHKEYQLGPKRHAKLQRQSDAYRCLCRSASRKLVLKTANTPVKTVSQVITAATTSATSGNGSKLDICRAIYAQYKNNLDRQGMIKLFVAKAGCTPAGASTYYNTCKNG